MSEMPFEFRIIKQGSERLLTIQAQYPCFVYRFDLSDYRLSEAEQLEIGFAKLKVELMKSILNAKVTEEDTL